MGRIGWTQAWVPPDEREECVPCYGTGLYFFAEHGYAAVEKNREKIDRIKSGVGSWGARYPRCGACHGEGYWRARTSVLAAEHSLQAAS